MQVAVMRNSIKVSFLCLLVCGQFGCSKQNNPAPDIVVASSPTPAAASPENSPPAVDIPQPPTQDAPGYYALGLELYKQNRDEQAAEAFQQAIKLDPGFGAAYMKLALAYKALGRKEDAEKIYEQAVEVYEKLVDKEPKNAEAQLNLGEAYSRLGDYQKSIEAYRRGVKLAEPDSATYYDIGLAYNKLARYTDAVGAFKKSIELDPNDYRAQEALERAQSDESRQKARIAEEKKKLERTTVKLNPTAKTNADRKVADGRNSSSQNTNQ
jgi:tetratricopeptide (TPR) repeat protein